MTKITTEELNKLKQLRQDTNSVINEYNDLNVQLLLLQKEVSTKRNEFYAKVDEQEAYLKELYDKYGEGSLDIETGEITS